jgi:hypothetical protein
MRYKEAADLRVWIREQGHMPINGPGGGVCVLRKQRDAILATLAAGAAGAVA